MVAGFRLQNFDQLVVLAAAALAAIVIALVTISFQSIRAAIANPVDSLRAE